MIFAASHCILFDDHDQVIAIVAGHAEKLELLVLRSNPHGSFSIPSFLLQFVGWMRVFLKLMLGVVASGPPYQTGSVTCEANKGAGRWYWPSLQTMLLKVDYETGNEDKGGTTEGDESIYLVGSEEHVSHISKRSGFSFWPSSSSCWRGSDE